MIYVLTFEYSDKSGFYISGITTHKPVAQAWLAASQFGEHRVYRVGDVIMTAGSGYPKWDGND